MFFKLIILTLTINSISCYFENCDQSYFLPAWTSFKIYNSGGTIGPVATSGKYMPGSSCRFTIKTSLDFAIKVVCNIKIDMPTKDCGSSRFQISRDGLYSLAGSEYFCPTNVQTVIRQSIDNTLVFGHTSEDDGNNAAGAYQCTLTSVYIGGLKCDCGWFVNKKIVNGTEATANEFTSMVGFYDLNEQKVFCGGSIIHRWYILSAAHCFIGSYANVKDMEARVGRENVYAGEDTIFAATYLIESIKKHEKYVADSATQNYDIALLRTTSPIMFSRGVGPSCLPFKFPAGYFDNQNLETAGWGTIEFAGPQPDILQKTSVKVLPYKKCDDSLTNQAKLCAFTQYTDTCQRDSGGSLYFTQMSRRYSVAIVSYGEACGIKPSVNTRVTSYLLWIRINTGYAYLCNK